MAALNPGRLALSVAAGLAVSVFAGLQTISMIATDTAPETAMALFPPNGEAYEKAAFERFREGLTDPAMVQPAAAAVSDLSLDALRRDPSSAKSHALLALAQEDEAQRNKIALTASRLNRRDLTLQGVLLEMRLAEGEYGPVIETLDQILRVHPNYRREFFPVLGEALQDERTIPVFADLFAEPSPWHVFFLMSYASNRPELVPNLAKVRAEGELLDEEFDRKLFARLVEAGELEAAGSLFMLLKDGTRRQVSGGALDWTSDFPPFDWRFVDEGDFRAQQSLSGDQLEVFARPGQGGIIAQRILPTPAAPFELRLTQTLEGSARAEAVRIELRCPGQEAPFFAQALEAGANILTVENAPCEQMQLGINARAFSGQQSLRTALSRIEITER